MSNPITPEMRAALAAVVESAADHPLTAGECVMSHIPQLRALLDALPATVQESMTVTPQAGARDADTELLDWIESQYKSTSVQMSGIATYVPTGQALRQLRGRSFRDAIRRAMACES